MILVTGATGLLGKHLIEKLLENKSHVRAIYRGSRPSLIDANLTWVKGDILDVVELEEAMEGIRYVYHCAAMVSFDRKDKKQLMQTNVEGTANIVNACINKKIEKLVYVSSVAAIGRAREGVTIDESLKWSDDNNRSTYGISKHLAEMEVWRGIGEGLDAVIANPTIILGAGNWDTGSTALFKSVYNEFPWFTNGITGFVDVNDVVDALMYLMIYPTSGERFIINGANVSYKSLFTAIASEFGKKPPHKEVTPFLAALIWRIEAIKTLFTRKKPLLTKETAIMAQSKVYFNNEKLLKAAKTFNYTPIEESIKRICKELMDKKKHV